MDVLGWLDARAGSDDRPAVQRAIAAMALEDAADAARADQRQAAAADAAEAKLTALRALGVGAGQMSAMALQVSEAEGRVAELRDQLARAERTAAALRAPYQELVMRLGEARELASRSVTVTGNPDLLAPARKTLDDERLLRARAALALRRIGRAS